MTEWRRFHFEWRGDQRFKAPQADAVIALAKLGIMPPRSLDPDPDNPDLSKLPQPGLLKDLQHDAHCWVNFEASAWKVRAIEDGVLHLWHGWRPKVEIWSIDLNQYTPAQWARYCEKAAAMLG
jgi:hypothetical protein